MDADLSWGHLKVIFTLLSGAWLEGLDQREAGAAGAAWASLSLCSLYVQSLQCGEFRVPGLLKAAWGS